MHTSTLQVYRKRRHRKRTPTESEADLGTAKRRRTESKADLGTTTPAAKETLPPFNRRAESDFKVESAEEKNKCSDIAAAVRQALSARPIHP